MINSKNAKRPLTRTCLTVEFEFIPSDSPQYTIHDDQIFIVKYPEFGPDGEPYKGLFGTCFRKKACSNCKKEKWANEYQWKIKGDEGPFSLLWGERDCWCKECRSSAKASFYKKTKKREKIIANFEVSFSADPDPRALVMKLKPLIEEIIS